MGRRRKVNYRYSRPSFDDRMLKKNSEQEEDAEKWRGFGAYDLVKRIGLADMRRALMITPATAFQLAKSAVTGSGIPLALWFPLWMLGTIYTMASLGVPEAVHNLLFSQSFMILASGFALGWVAPLSEMGYVADRLGALRANIWYMLPLWHRVPDIIVLLPHFWPHIRMFVRNIEHLAPLCPMLDKHWEIMRPEMADFLDKFDDMEPLLPIMGARVDQFESHVPKLIPHWRKLMPHAKVCAPYIDDLLPLLQVRGWEEAMPFIDDMAPHVPQMAPHVKRLIPYMDPALPYIGILAKNIDKLAPQMEATLEVMDRLVPLIHLLPIADQTGIMNSRLALMSLPTMALLLPRPSSSDKLRALASPLPGAESMSLRVEAAGPATFSNRVILYVVVLNGTHRRKMRYSELLELHDRMIEEISTYCKMKLSPFPEKTPFGMALSPNGVERRRLSLEIYLESLARQSGVLAEESAAFRSFIRSFTIAGHLV